MRHHAVFRPSGSWVEQLREALWTAWTNWGHRRRERADRDAGWDLQRVEAWWR